MFCNETHITNVFFWCSYTACILTNLKNHSSSLSLPCHHDSSEFWPWADSLFHYNSVFIPCHSPPSQAEFDTVFPNDSSVHLGVNRLCTTIGGLLLVRFNTFYYLSASHYTSNPLWYLNDTTQLIVQYQPTLLLVSQLLPPPFNCTLTYFSIPLFCYGSSKLFLWEYAKQVFRMASASIFITFLTSSQANTQYLTNWPWLEKHVS